MGGLVSKEAEHAIRLASGELDGKLKHAMIIGEDTLKRLSMFLGF